MRKRFRRKHKVEDANGSRRFPMGLLFTIVAILVLIAVLGYDRHEQNEAKDQAALAGEMLNRGKVSDALAEYKRALENPRLNKRGRAEIAVKIANIYFDHLEDYGLANVHYALAKQLWPASVRTADVQQRMQLAQQRAQSQSDSDFSTTSSLAHGRLISPPEVDSSGTIVARVGTTEIRAGEIERLISRLGDTERDALRRSADKMDDFVRRHMERVLLYRAALDEGFQRSDELQETLYEYQRDLLARRLEQRTRETAQVVTIQEVKNYYESNRGKFVTSASVTLSMIKTDSSEAASSVSEALHAGAKFEDAATSFSTPMQNCSNLRIKKLDKRLLVNGHAILLPQITYEFLGVANFACADRGFNLCPHVVQRAYKLGRFCDDLENVECGAGLKRCRDSVGVEREQSTCKLCIGSDSRDRSVAIMNRAYGAAK